MPRLLCLACLFAIGMGSAAAQEQLESVETIPIWPDLAPGETSRDTGTPQPPRAGESPPVTRVGGIRRPLLDAFLASSPNGTGVLILPGGGFKYVVPDKEGSEVAAILNKHGVSVFVLRYRTKRDAADPGWRQALQDGQRAMKVLRSDAERFGLAPDRIGLMGFSAGGQAAGRLLTDGGQLAYDPIDAVDALPHRPDFGVLVYPWRLYDPQTDALLPELRFDPPPPPSFLVYAHDDRNSSLSGALFYVALKKADVEAELHIHATGGHGYGVRPVPGSSIDTWTDRLLDWLRHRDLINR